MLDIKRIRDNKVEVQAGLDKRGNYDLNPVLALDEKHRKMLTNVEEMKSRQNIVSKEIPKFKKENKDCSEIFTEMKELSEKIKDLDAEIKVIDNDLSLIH